MIEFIFNHVQKSVHYFRMTLKRTVTLDSSSRPSKKRKENLSRKVSTLSRQVNRMKPEIRQESYTLTVVASRETPIPLINDRQLQEAGVQEIRLHRIRVSYSYVSDMQNWAVMYSPAGNYSDLTAHGLRVPTSAHSIENFFCPLDSTNSKVYKSINLVTDLNIKSSDVNTLVNIDHRFSIPKKIRFMSEGTTSLAMDQICLIGGPRGLLVNQGMTVTLWYSHN